MGVKDMPMLKRLMLFYVLKLKDRQKRNDQNCQVKDPDGAAKNSGTD